MASRAVRKPGLSLRRHQLKDASLQAREQRWIEFECCQVGCGQYSGRLLHLPIPGAEVFVEEQNRQVHKFGRIPDGACTVSVISESGKDGWFLERPLGDDASVFLLPGGTEFDLYLPANTRTMYIVFDYAELLDDLRNLDPTRWALCPTELQCVQTVHRKALIRSMLELMNGHRTEQLDDRLTRARLRQVALTALSDRALIDAERFSHRRRTAILRAAREIMHESLSLDRPLGMVDICRSLGVSERSLQYSFRELMDTTPTAYFRTLRLHTARKRLVTATSGEQSVTRVAMQCGFHHLGRFSREYRRQFGELPSATLMRRFA